MKSTNFPVKIKINMSWGEMDAFGHLNNMYYFRYFENARIAYFEKMGFMELKEKEKVGPILAHTSCQYLKPLTYPDTLEVGARVKSIGNSSFVMEYQIISKKIGLAATGEGVIVTVNYETGEKTALPEKLKQRIMELESE